MLGNDSDADGLNISSVSVTELPSNSTAVTDNDGKITYTPNAEFLGNDTLTYQVCDLGNPVMCSQAQVFIAVYDPQVNNVPIANNDYILVVEGQSKDCMVLDNDLDPEGDIDTSSLTLDKLPLHGTATVSSGEGKITYTADPGYRGYDTLKYVICDKGLPSLCDTAFVYLTINSIMGMMNTKQDLLSVYPNPGYGEIFLPVSRRFFRMV